MAKHDAVLDKITSGRYFSLNREGEIATRWYKDNLLQGNHDKYQVMTVCNKNQDSSITVSVDGSNIQSSTDLKLLGVTIDSRMTFNAHIREVCKKTSMKIGALLRLRNIIPTDAKLQLYKAAILPNFTYCHTVWHFCRASDSRKLERLQERALRAVYNNKSATYEQLLAEAKLSSLHNRRLQDIAILKENCTQKMIYF